MAHGHHDTGLTWEWDSVLLLSNPHPLASPSLEADGSTSTGLRGSLRSALPSSSDQGHHQHSNETSASHLQTDSPSSETQYKSSNGDKRGDPRLDCPNFLAGRVPCACTDNDDDDSGFSRKRSKPVPICQVAACGAELTDLKGYHQRHRVCLRCAHATRVILREQPHRYCQQCGKFHPICDFDEGKRSCRRKLEKHNNRRRRKAGEDSLQASDYGGDTDTQNECSPGDGLKFDVLSEGEPKDYIGEKPYFDTEETLRAAEISSNKEQTVTVKVSEASDVPDEMSAGILSQASEPSVATDLKQSMPNPERVENCTEVSPLLEMQFGEEQPCSVAEQIPFAVDPRQESIPIICPDDFSLHNSPLPDTEGVSPMRRENDDESLLALLMEENGIEHSHFSENAGKQLISHPTQLWESSTSPRRLSKEVTYLSPLPTGRISFKLYDWNPGDFPRQLRQQVMEWLSNMPVDLEGYIRSGCTILTIFIAMPQSEWDKLRADWAGSVLKLVKAEEKLSRFWSSGYLIARMDDLEVHINNGELAQPLCERLCESPVLHRVHPLCLEAGHNQEVVIHGENFQQAQSRLLVSFNGKYILNDVYLCSKQGSREGPVSRVTDTDNREDEMLVVSMPALLSKRSGTAYIEVEHLSGTSNYIPLLVAEKKIVDEVRTLEMEVDMPTSCCNSRIYGSPSFPHLSRIRAHSMLLDLGWVLKNVYSENVELDFCSESLELHVVRLQRLLFFGVKRGWYNVVESVLHLANKAGLMEKIGILENGLSALHVAVLYRKVAMVGHLISCGESLCASSSECKYWWNPGFPGPMGLTPLHIIALQPGARDISGTLLKKKDIASMWNHIQDHLGQTPQCYSKLRKDLAYRVQMNDLISHIESNQKADVCVNLHELLNVQCEDNNSSSLKRESRTLISSLPFQAGLWKVTSRTTVGVIGLRLPVPFQFFGHKGLSMYISRGRKRNHQLLSSASVLLVCAGICVMLQCPNQVIMLSLSLQRYLWGLENGSQ